MNGPDSAGCAMGCLAFPAGTLLLSITTVAVQNMAAFWPFVLSGAAVWWAARSPTVRRRVANGWHRLRQRWEER